MCSLEEAWSSEEFKNLEKENCDPNYFCLPDNYFDNPQGLEKEQPEILTEEENLSNYNFNDDLLETNSIQNLSEKKVASEEPEDNLNNQNNVQQEEPFVSSYKESFTNNQNEQNQDIQKTLKLILDKIDTIEEKLKNSDNTMKNNVNSNNNVHDIILFIIIGVFILFALDSIFKIGKMTI